MDGINDGNGKWESFVLSKTEGRLLLISDHVDCDINSLTFQKNILPPFQSKSARIQRRRFKRPTPKLLHVSVRIKEHPSRNETVVTLPITQHHTTIRSRRDGMNMKHELRKVRLRFQEHTACFCSPLFLVVL